MLRSLAFLYINNEKSEKELNILGINLLKETKELYLENYDTNERNQR